MAIKALRNETELLAKVASGDQRAFNELFDAYYNLLGEYVFKLTKSLSATEEIVQDAFIKIWLKRVELTGLNSFSNYLFIICRNKTYNYLRDKSKELVFNKEFENFLKDESEIDALDNPSDAYRALIANAVDKLPPQAKKVYLLSRHDRLKHDEIAKQLQISAETVKKHIQYAVNFIKKDVHNQIDLGILLVLMSPLILN